MKKAVGWVSATLTRRRALAVAAALAGSGAVSSAAGAGRFPNAGAIRIGRIVAPKSPRGAAATSAILDGLSSGLARRGLAVDLPDIQRYRNTPAAGLRVAKGHQTGVTIVVGRPTSSVSNAMLAIDTGANLPEAGQTMPVATLDVWGAAWTTGRWAAAELGRSAVIATSFYDSGYDSLYALHHGFESAGGAATVHLTHRPAGEVDFGDLTRLIEGSRPDVIFAAYSGREGDEALRFLKAAGYGIPIVGAPLLTDESSLGDSAAGVYTVLPWAADLPAGRDFAAAYKAMTGKPAGGFAALGDLASSILAGGDAQDPTSFYLRKVVRTSGRVWNSAIADLSAFAPSGKDRRLAAAGLRSGFSSPYALA